jgi:hypothetical protein
MTAQVDPGTLAERVAAAMPQLERELAELGTAESREERR